MNTVALKIPKRKWWKPAAEWLFVAWVMVINFLYYNQFKVTVLRRVAKLFYR
jgi:hypothetical protein